MLDGTLLVASQAIPRHGYRDFTPAGGTDQTCDPSPLRSAIIERCLPGTEWREGEMRRRIRGRRTLLVVAAIAMCLISTSPAPAAVAGWTTTGSMATARCCHTATR